MNKKLTYFIRSFMRISTIVVIWICLGGSLTYAKRGHAQRLSDYKLNLSIGDESLHAVLTKISEQTRISFAYDREALSNVMVRSGDYRNEPLDKALQSILTGTGYQYEVMNRNVVISKKPIPKPQKPGKITGRVVDAGTGEPLEGVTVQESMSGKSTLTDEDGNFTLEVMPGVYRLSARFIGYETTVRNNVKVEDGGLTQINMTLVSTTSELDEVVVMGYGTQTKRLLSAAISSVKGEEVNQVTYNSVATSLKGKATGLRVYNPSGQPGADAVITIRGGSSINKSNNALILIDGFPGSISGLNPQDVESIEVLKDAASTAIYGARASNGIILITTKQGTQGRTNFSVNANSGYQEASRRIDRLNAEEFLQVTRPALARSPYSAWLTATHPAGTGNTNSSNFSTRFLVDGEEVPAGWKSMPDPLDPTRTLIFEDTDVERNTFIGGYVSNFFLSADGGDDRFKYLASLGYTKDNGFIIGSDWERMSGRANFSYDFTEKLSLFSNLSVTRSIMNSFALPARIFSNGIHLAPTLRSVLPNGETPGGSAVWMNNPRLIVETQKNESFDLKFMGQLGLGWKITDDLTAKMVGFYNPTVISREYFERANMYNSMRPAELYGNINQTYQGEATVAYAKQLADHHKIDAILGASMLSYDIFGHSAAAQGGSSDDIPTLNASSEYLNASSTRETEQLNSFFGRASYAYKSKYLLSGTFRADGSSKFSEANRWGFFPGVSAGWIVSDEYFMESVANTIGFLKLRASYGLTGNNTVGRYDYQGLWSVTPVYGGESGAIPISMPNYGLAWERSRQFDVGIDFSLFARERINISADFYDKITDNLLFAKPLPNTSGYSTVETNIGQVKFWGVETSLNAKLIDNENFGWTVGGNFSYNMNRVLRLPDNDRMNNRIGGLEFSDGTSIGGIAEGERMYQVTGHRVAYLIDNQEQANNAMYDQNATGYDPETNTFLRGRKFPGDFEWVDGNGDGQINGDDRFVLGYVVPTTTGGMNTSFRYKGVRLHVLADYALGHVIHDQQISRLNSWNLGGNITPTKTVLNAWKEPGDAARTNLPRFDAVDSDLQNNWFRTSDRTAFNGDYLAIREVRLSYIFPASALSRLRLQSMELYGMAQNLLILAHYPGYVVEYSGTGNNHSDHNYPLPRILSVGLNIGFQ